MTAPRDEVVSAIAHLTALMRNPDVTTEQKTMLRELLPGVCQALCAIFEVSNESIAAAALELAARLERVN